MHEPRSKNASAFLNYFDFLQIIILHKFIDK